MITVIYRAEMQTYTHCETEQLPPCRVSDVLKHIRKTYGRDAEKHAKSMLIVVDGESILIKQVFRTEIRDGQSLSFLPVCGGG